MRIEIIPCLQDNYSYLIIDESNNFACVVDPSESEPIINFLKNKNIKIFKSLALNNLNSSIINESNLGVKNLFADLGIFLIEK
jgi:hypothetical protein